MSKAPSMPMFWDAYLADTTHLTTEEHGAYMLLLAAMWRRNGWVPDDDRDNARILGLTPAKWRKIRDRLSEFLTVRDGMITQKNLLKIWENTQEKIEKNKSNGSKGGRPKSKQNNDLEKANGFNSDKPNETIPEPEPEPDKEEDKSSSSQEVEDYQNFLKAHPRPVSSEAGAKAFADLIAAGEKAEVIIGAARAYAEVVKRWSSEGKVQQSDNFLDPVRGKWRDYAGQPKLVAASKQDRMEFWAKSINEGRFVSAATLTPAFIRDLIDAGLVTPEKLAERGIAA